MNTDTRHTLDANQNFYELVKVLFEGSQPAALLYESSGVTRANGMITDLFEKEGFSWLKLNNNLEIRIDSLYAINGTFSYDYSEC